MIDWTGAVYGQLAGAYYGEQGIPIPWREIIAYSQLIESYADRLYYASGMMEKARSERTTI